jgi:cytochrome c oxidase cbb3-type subunit 2
MLSLRSPLSFRVSGPAFRRNGRMAGAAMLTLLALACSSAPAAAQPTLQAAAAATTAAPEPAAVPASVGAEPDRGAELYSRQCATCHGETGLGDGPASYLLWPKPRNFVRGTFRVVSTENGNPSDEDLLQTLRRGMPGSAMPPWGHLSDADLEALVDTVRNMLIEGRVAADMDYDEDLSREEALADVLDDYMPGPEADIPAPPPDERIDLERGADLYEKGCAACHGPDGRANVPVEKFDSDGWPIGARDFTRGIFKGGSRPIDIARRIYLGMPGTPMPGNPMKQDELWSVVAYVEQMIDREVEQRVLQTRKLLAAPRVDVSLTTDPGADAWKRAESAGLALMPLWWRNDRPETVNVQALHDGEHLAVRLSWSDATRNDLVLDQQGFSDGCAVQLSAGTDPPFFGMGDALGRVNIWHWHASWQRDLDEGAPSLGYLHRNAPTGNLANSGAPQDELFSTGAAAGNPVSQVGHRNPVEDLNAQGQGTISSQPGLKHDAEGEGRWRPLLDSATGEWSVVFLRAIRGSGEDDVAAQPGERVSIAFAVWDGAAGDRNGVKSVTIWHELQLED